MAKAPATARQANWRGYDSFNLWVPGIPVAQGSMRSPKAGVVLHNSPSLAGWRDAIAWAAKDQWRGQPLIDQPIALYCTFLFPVPQKPRHIWYRDTAPDLDKLIRAVGDALEGVVIKNDARIVRVQAGKYWAENWILGPREPGVHIRLETVAEDGVLS